jgi:uncharacterized protein YegP (UPF0339 family)
VTSHTPRNPRLVIYEAADGHRWHLRAGNGRIVAESGEAYSTHSKARRAAEALYGYARAARIIDPGPWKTP